VTNRIAPLALAALAGCTTAMELGRAETLARGEWELGGALGFSGYSNEREAPLGEATGGTTILIPLLPFEEWVAYGITDRLEVSARVGTLSAQLGLKAGLIRSPDFSLALAGGVAADAYGRFLDGGALRSRLALIAGKRLPGRFELDLAPQCAWPLDPGRWRPELLGATASAYYVTAATGRRIGLAVTWLRYLATAPEPGEMSRADYLGLALVFHGRRGVDHE
jgi:hypothetical protein